MSAPCNKAVWLLAATMILDSCSMSSPNETIVRYVPPANLTAQNAVLVGGLRNERSWIQPYEYAYVWAVDGAPVAAPEDQWMKPLPLPAGQPLHLTLAYSLGGFFGSSELVFTGEPGTRVNVDYSVVSDQSAVQLWLEDARTGRPLTHRLLVKVGATNPGVAVTPIFIPRR